MRILAVCAHPDDETCASGYLLQQIEQGHEAYLLFTTRGEGGSCGDPPLCAQDELGRWREGEARRAGEQLGVREVIFLPYVDPLFRDGKLLPINATLEQFSQSIQDVLNRLRPEVVLTHGSFGEYGHPQHIFTFQAVFHALRQLAPWRPQEILTWGAAYPNPRFPNQINPNDPANLVLDVSPWLARKTAAFMEHRSQFAGFLQFNPGNTLAELVEQIESFHRWDTDPAATP